MKGYVNIPKSIYCKLCKQCGARPIIALAGNTGYVVKCPSNNDHYQTPVGLIDIEDWNIHNTVLHDDDYNLQLKQADN
ncbi:hypothetical protein FFF34_008890 [Inquilinus sp. KBS0705]|nr:hypothetical protein FFF34_008890 [Inquilinus sp. KBS0705]